MAETKLRDKQMIVVTAVNGLIEAPAAKEYTLSQYTPFAGLLRRMTAKSSNASASGTLQVKVDGAAVTFAGGAFTISDDTEVTDTISAGGSFARGNTLVLAVSAPSNLDDLAITLEYERYGSE